jgi:tRNA (mo5U34)-methyltransferase
MPNSLLSTTAKPLLPFSGEFDSSTVLRESKKSLRLIHRSPHWRRIRKEIFALPGAGEARCGANLCEESISADLPPKTPQGAVNEILRSLISWRVGPYRLGEISIDSEWRSHRKWARISPLLKTSPGMKIADVGCSNGYFMYKLATLHPELVVGFDPIERCWLQFALLQRLLNVPNVAFVPTGILSLDSFCEFFDLVLCMGVLYHQRDHALAVQRLYEATKPGGRVVLESLVVEQEEPLSITPPDRYAKMRNAWLIPSPSHLESLFKNAGFKDVAVHRFGPLTTDEQRSTDLAPFESLADFLDPKDPSRTVEGHPAPHTAAVVGIR